MKKPKTNFGIPRTLPKFQTFLHISPAKNRESILKHGLSLTMPYSGYGEPPMLEALYFYHEDNINVIYDMINTFDDFDIWEVKGLYKEYMLPDEDSGTDTWQASLQKFGTFAYKQSVPVKNVKFMCNINRDIKRKIKA